MAVIDQSMESFNRLDAAFPGGRIEGHALDDDVLLLAGIEHADASMCTDGEQHEPGDRADRAAEVRVVTTVVRILDPARADLSSRLGLRTVCPTTTAIDTLSNAVLSAEIEV